MNMHSSGLELSTYTGEITVIASQKLLLLQLRTCLLFIT